MKVPDVCWSGINYELVHEDGERRRQAVNQVHKLAIESMTTILDCFDDNKLG